MSTELLFRDDAYLKTATARVVGVQNGQVELDRTIFYPLGGGQPGDIGQLIRENGEQIAVTDTRKGATPGSVAHLVAAGGALPEVGESSRSRSTGRGAMRSCGCTPRCT